MPIGYKGVDPYVGPRPFERTEQDRGRFFGRDQETQEIISLMFGHPLLLVYAQSGAGKTSLFNARIAPTLEEEGFEVLPLTRVSGLIPEGVDPQAINNLYVFHALQGLQDVADPGALLDKSLVAFLQERPDRPPSWGGRPAPRAIVFDQFEELFTSYPVGWREQQEGFFRQVTEALEDDPLLRAVLVIREDCLAQLDPFAQLLPERLRIRLRIERLGKEAARQAIEGPLVKLETGRSFTPEAAEYLVEQLLRMKVLGPEKKVVEVEGPYVEPVQLQVVCSRLWGSLPSGEKFINRAHIAEAGDVDEALSEFYKRAIKLVVEENGLGEGERGTPLARWPGSPIALSKRVRSAIREAKLRTWFEEQLITPQQTRGTVSEGPQDTGGIPNSMAQALEDIHIVRCETRAGARWYELTHDRFIKPILESNRRWREKRRGRQVTAFATGFALLALVVLVGLLIAQARVEAAQAEAIQQKDIADVAAANLEAVLNAPAPPTEIPTRLPTNISTITSGGPPSSSPETSMVTPTPIATPTPNAATATIQAAQTQLLKIQATQTAIASSPTPAPTTSLVVYAESGGQTHKLGTVRPNGAIVPSGISLDHAAAPAWSPDGGQIAFFGEPGINSVYPEFREGEGVWRMSYPRGAPAQLLATDHVKNVAWSPDGAYIAFEVRPPEQPAKVVIVRATDGQELHRFDGQQPAWYPDEDKLIIKAEPSGGGCGLRQVALNGRLEGQITTDCTDSYPVISPDGQYLAFSSQRGGNWDIYLMELPDGEPQRVTKERGTDTTPVFSRDGQKLYYRSNSFNPNWQVIVMDLDGSNPVAVRNDVRASNDDGLARPAVY